MPRKREFSPEAPSSHAMAVGRRDRRPVERFVAGPSAAHGLSGAGGGGGVGGGIGGGDGGGGDDDDSLAVGPDEVFADLLERANTPP